MDAYHVVVTPVKPVKPVKPAAVSQQILDLWGKGRGKGLERLRRSSQRYERVRVGALVGFMEPASAS